MFQLRRFGCDVPLQRRLLHFSKFQLDFKIFWSFNILESGHEDNVGFFFSPIPSHEQSSHHILAIGTGHIGKVKRPVLCVSRLFTGHILYQYMQFDVQHILWLIDATWSFTKCPSPSQHISLRWIFVLVCILQPALKALSRMAITISKVHLTSIW